MNLNSENDIFYFINKPKKAPVFPYQYDKLKNHLLRIGPVKTNYINLMVLSF